MEDHLGDFGVDEPSNVIPFPRLRANQKLADAWRSEVDARNKKNGSKHEFPAPDSLIAKFMEQRTLPRMPWPGSLTAIGERARSYPGDCIGVVGAIGGGKTSFAIQAALGYVGNSYPVLWNPLELTKDQILARIVGNMHGVHAMNVRDQWPEDRITHSLAAVTDLWHFVDRHFDPDVQINAVRDAIELCWQIYRVPPLVVVDHMGQLVGEAKDARLAMIRAGQRFGQLAEDYRCFIMLLAQGSRANQGALTGKVEFDSAADGMGMAAESSMMESICANVVVLTTFKVDDAMELDGHALVSKARWSGREGKVGTRFSKPGGVLTELDYLPTTPLEVKAKVEKDKKDKHRNGPAPTMAQAREDLNAAREGDADAARRVYILKVLTRHGAMGMDLFDIRKIQGAGRGGAPLRAIQELERAGSVERYNNRWRIVTRME